MIGRDMSLAEAARHVERFRADPSTALAAEVEGWVHPVPRIEAILMDLWDLTAAATGTRRPPRYRRPWAVKDQNRHGKPRPRSEVVEILNRFGHDLPV